MPKVLILLWNSCYCHSSITVDFRNYLLHRGNVFDITNGDCFDVCFLHGCEYSPLRCSAHFMYNLRREMEDVD